MKLGQYHFIRPLQRQPSGLNFLRSQLYLVQTAHNPSWHVLKLLPVVAENTQQYLFLNEIKVLRQLNALDSPYWLVLQDSGQDNLIDDCSSLKPQVASYLLLPYIEQGSVKQLLDRQSLTLQQTQQLWMGMLDAVDALHQRGWLHLDIKPSNFLINTTTAHASLQIYLIDFALAQPVNYCESFANFVITQGTPRYMSPEQFLGQPVNRQSDFYNLGLILYELLTRKSMFNATSYHGWAMQHCQHPVALLPDPLAGFQPLIDGLLAKNRQNRLYQISEIRQMAQHAFQITEPSLAILSGNDKLHLCPNSCNTMSFFK